MKASDIFPGKYLKAADLGTSEPTVTVERVAMETLGDESKAIVYFKGKTRGIVLNKTNWNTLVELSGEDDCDDWKGTRVKLYVTKVEYAGKRVPAIRMTEPDGDTSAAKAAPAKALSNRRPEPAGDIDAIPVMAGDLDDSDLPF